MSTEDQKISKAFDNLIERGIIYMCGYNDAGEPQYDLTAKGKVFAKMLLEDEQQNGL